MTRRAIRNAAAAALTIAGLAATAPPAGATEWWETDPACNQWCQGRFKALQAADRGDMVGVINNAFASYSLGETWWAWGVVTAQCESHLNPTAHSGWYRGLFQHDPEAWPRRAALAGLPGADIDDPVANAQVTAWMAASGYIVTVHWPVCGRNRYAP